MMRAGRILICFVYVMLLSVTAFAQQRPDAEIRAELQKRIQPISGVTFDVNKGVVTLNGTVTGYAQKMGILNIVHRVIGVRTVVDHITVVPTQKRTDDQILQSVRSVLVGNLSRAELAAINIKVENSTVILSGTLANSYPKQIAGILSGWVPGVVNVTNNIVVKPSEIRTDLDIQSDVVSRFNKNPFISEQKIDVSVTNGVVVLSGVVDNFMTADQAEAVARFTPGVRDVNNLLFVRALGR